MASGAKAPSGPMNKEHRFTARCIAAIAFLGALSLVSDDFVIIPRRTSDLRRKLSQQSINPNDPDVPKIAWLMTFPQDGARFLQRAIHLQTSTSTGVNFGHSVMNLDGAQEVSSVSSVPIYVGQHNGPFFFSTEHPLPKKGFILTRTFCSGFCKVCFAKWYNQPPKDFLYECSVSSYFKDNKVHVGGHYDRNIVKKAVHLVRNPFTHVAARFEDQHQKWIQSGMIGMAGKYPRGREGFKKYCEHQDNSHNMRLILDEERTWNKTQEGRDLADIVPCHADFYRIIHWHNNMFHVREKELKDMEFKEVRYEDLSDKPQEILNDLYDYLGLEQKYKDIPPLEDWTEGAVGYYTDEEVIAVKNFIQYFASTETLKSFTEYMH